MKKKKPRHGGCASVALCAVFAVVLGVLLLYWQAGQEHISSVPDKTTAEPLHIFKPEYLDTTESLYRYNDPENGIGSMVGIDVSEHQGALDWNFWRDSGLEFAFIRAGFRGYGTGAIVEDRRYQENLLWAKAAGLKCGVYFYSQAVSAEEAREEAAYVLALLDGIALELPVAFDWEIPPSSDARTWELPAATLQECAVAFCEEIRAAGYTPMLYANAGSYRTYRAEPRLDDIDIWYAQYTTAETYADGYSIWQYTQTGSVNGSLSIDLNLAFLNRAGELLSAAEIAALQTKPAQSMTAQ